MSAAASRAACRDMPRAAEPDAQHVEDRLLQLRADQDVQNIAELDAQLTKICPCSDP